MAELGQNQGQKSELTESCDSMKGYRKQFNGKTRQEDTNTYQNKAGNCKHTELTGPAEQHFVQK